MRDLNYSISNTFNNYFRNIEFDLGFLDPTLQCVTNLGEVELSYCTGNDNCNLIGVFVLNGNCFSPPYSFS